MQTIIVTFHDAQDLSRSLCELLASRFRVRGFHVTEGEGGFRLFVHGQYRRRNQLCGHEASVRFAPLDVNDPKPCYADETVASEDGTVDRVIRTYAVPMPGGQTYLMIELQSVPALSHSALMD